MGGVTDDVLLARAYLNRVAEPANIPVWALVRDLGPVEAARVVRAGAAGLDDVVAATSARRDVTDPHADLDAAHRRGIRLVVPESDDWPHFAMAALEHAGLARLAEYRNGLTRHADHGEPIPPLALWARGPGDLASLAVRSVGIVGSRASTDYGEMVARRLARGLSETGFAIVSGGAYGIDRAAHRGALDADGYTVLVSAGGLDAPYPPGNARLFDVVAETGLLLSESPPGSAPQRRRFLTRNRLVAGLSTGCVVVEAARVSGALNTLGHCSRLDRAIMAVPGPVTSAMSAGSHFALTTDRWTGSLVTGVQDVLEIIGGPSDLIEDTSTGRGPSHDSMRARLDGMDDGARTVFDGFPANRAVLADELMIRSGLPASEVFRALPLLELAGLVEACDGGFRMVG